jgi:hypothetical protein
MTQLPLACELSTVDLQRRKAGLLASVRTRATALTPSLDGLRAEFPDSPTVLADILELIRLESACCRFLQFDLRTGPQGAPTTLTLSGPPGTDTFLAGLGWSAPGAV